MGIIKRQNINPWVTRASEMYIFMELKWNVKENFNTSLCNETTFVILCPELVLNQTEIYFIIYQFNVEEIQHCLNINSQFSDKIE